MACAVPFTPAMVFEGNMVATPSSTGMHELGPEDLQQQPAEAASGGAAAPSGSHGPEAGGPLDGPGASAPVAPLGPAADPAPDVVLAGPSAAAAASSVEVHWQVSARGHTGPHSRACSLSP